MWLFIPSMESDCAAGRLGLNWDLKSLFPDTGPSRRWNGKLRSPGELRRAWKKDPSIRLLSGMTSRPSTVARGAEKWISSLPGSHASHFRLQDNGKEPPTTGGFGPILSASLASSTTNRNPAPSSLCFSKTSPDSCSIPIATLTPSGIWETSQMRLSGDFQPYSGIWPNSVSMRNRCVYERPTLEPRTVGSEFSFWPTGNAHDASGQRGPGFTLTDRHYKAHDLNTAAEQWPTPKAKTGGPNSNRENRPATGGPDLQEAVGQWATPTVPNGGRVITEAEVLARGATDRGKRQVGLEMETVYWPTPAERDHRSPNKLPYSDRGGGTKGEQLANLASFWKTPHGQGNVDEDGHQGGAGGGEFSKQATNWATPRAEDSESCGNPPNREDRLTGQTRLWAEPDPPEDPSSGIQWRTPTERDHHPSTRENRTKNHAQIQLAHQVESWTAANAEPPPPSSSPEPAGSSPRSHSDQTTPDGPTCWCGSLGCALVSHIRKLNPFFETWLMGWPLFWLLTEPELSGRSEMASWLSKQRSGLSSLCAERGL